MDDRKKTKVQLVEELEALRAHIARLEGAEPDAGRLEGVREEIEMLDGIIKTAPTIILVLDLKGNIVSFNPYMEKLCGYKIEEVKGKDWFENFLPQADWKKIRKVFRNAVNDIDTSGTINPIRTKDGRMIDIEWSNKTLKDKNGNLFGVLSIGQDITERKQAEEKLRLMDMVVEQSHDGFAVVDGDGYIQFCNKAWAGMHGYVTDEIAGKHLGTFHTEEQFRDDVTPFNIKVMEHGFHKGEVGHKRKDGTTFPTMMTSFVLKNEEGKLIGIVGMARDITERKHAEADLNLAYSELNQIFNTAGDGMRLVDMDFNMLRFNNRFVKNTGISAEEMEGKKCYEVFPGDKCDTDDCPLVRIKAGEELYELDVEKMRKDGQVVPYIVTATPFKDPDGHLIGIVENFKDITERKWVEEMTIAQRDLGIELSTAVGMDETIELCLNAAIRVSGLDCGGIYLVNDESGDLDLVCHKGLPPDFVKVVSHYDADAPNTRLIMEGKAIYAVYPELVAGLKGLKDQEGLRAIAVIPFHHEGKVIGCINVSTHKFDQIPSRTRVALEAIASQIGTIVAHAKTQEARRASETLYRLLADNVTDVIWTIDMNLNFQYVSPSVEVQRGFTPDEVMTQSLEEILPPDSLKLVLSLMEAERANIASGDFKPVTLELGFYRKDGSIVVTESTIGIYYDKEMVPAFFVGISRDITERKKAEDDRRNLEAQMQHMQKLESLGVLAGGIAHDFNNLLMGILGHADLAIMELTPESPARYNIEQVQTAAVRASELTNQMLAFSGKGRFVVEALNVNKIIEEMVHLIDVSIAKNAVLKLKLTENIPPIEADAAQVRQVILNLITNASDAIGDRSGVITITTGLIDADRAYLTSTFLDERLADGRYTYIEVSDTGVGMDAETIENIFDPFFTTKFTGRGLGLAAVLGIIRGHDGAIKVYSEPGKGTTFKVLFPSSELQYELGDRETGIRELKNWRGSGTILIIDDEEAVREVASLMLKRFGFDILTARDGREAIEIYREHIDEIVGVLLDMTMPHMGGEETFTELRRITPDVKVLLCSGYNEQDATSHFTGKGLAGFIQKPFQLEKLVLKMYRILKDKDSKS